MNITKKLFKNIYKMYIFTGNLFCKSDFLLYTYCLHLIAKCVISYVLFKITYKLLI